MFDFFKKKCPVCKMELKKDKKFCSDNCEEEYRKKLAKEQSKPSCGCCR